MNSIVALPIAAAMPTSSPLLAGGGPDRRAMHAYASWLFMERRILCRELWPHVGTEAERFDWQDNAGAYWHFEGRAHGRTCLNHHRARLPFLTWLALIGGRLMSAMTAI